MHLATDPTGHRVPQTDTEIDAVVGAFMAELIGAHRPVAPAVRHYEHAMEPIAEQVTELLATLAGHR